MLPRNSSLSIFFAALICILSGCKDSDQIDCQIVGHSMALAYKSKHSVATCDQCGFEFSCDVVEGKTPNKVSVICGNCGEKIDQKCLDRPADQVKLFPGEPIRRWDVVAFRRGDRVLVKRVIGLPSDIVDFSEGNLQVGGKVVRKPKMLWHEVSTLVYDSRPAASQTNSKRVSERIVPRAKDVWDFTEKSIAHAALQTADDDRSDWGFGQPEFDFLDYRHRRCYKNSDEPETPAAIDDANPFNQSIRRTPHRVDELDVRLEVTFADKGSIQIERTMPTGTISATLELHDDQTVALLLTRRSGRDVKTVESEEFKVSDKSVEIRLVNYDDLIHLFVDGTEPVNAIPLESIENPKRFEIDASQPVVSIGVSREDAVTIERLSIWRDWHLFQDSPKPSVKLPLKMGKRGYYVVGDNLTVSEDSRHFGIVHDIIGVVKPVDDN